MKVLFMAPHAAIWVHAFPEALLAESLAKNGHEIIYVTCDREFSGYCAPMTAAGLLHDSPAAAKARICTRCQHSAGTIKRNFGFRGNSIGDYLDAADRQQVAKLVGEVTRENFLDLRVDGVTVGRFATYELLLNRKKQSLEFTDGEWDEYATHLGNALRSLIACRRILDVEKPDRIVVYNSLYAVNHVACALFESRGVPAYFLHAGGNLSRRMETLLVGRKDGVRLYERLLAFWPSVRHQPCSNDVLARVTDHFLELLRGQHVYAYSAPKSKAPRDLHAEFRIPAGRKLVVATMSSPDERFAAQTINVMKGATGQIFGSQAEWIRALCNWMAGRPDLHLVIRVHPRELPNKRENVTSEHAMALVSIFEELPSNAVVNWPGENISLYDLAGITDVFLNAWSAAGKEMSMLGIPVVVYSPDLLVYPPDLNYSAASAQEYFERIDQALADGWNSERMRAAFRWCAFEYERSVIDIRESYSANVSTLKGRLRNILARVAVRFVPHLWQTLDCKRRARALAASTTINAVLERKCDTLLEVRNFSEPEVALEEETAAIRLQAGRLAKIMYGSSHELTSSDKLGKHLFEFANGG